MSHPISASLPEPHQLIEVGLAAAHPYDAVILVEESFDCDIRFANNTTTTNGVRRSRSVTVALFVPHSGGVAVGIASRSGLVDIGDLVGLAKGRAAASAPAGDASPLITGTHVSSHFADPAVETNLALFSGLVKDLGESFSAAKSKDHVLAGFAQHEVETTYLGSTRGLRLRHVQPTGSFELVARSLDGSASTWVGRGTSDFSDISLPEIYAHLEGRLAHATRRIDLPAGRYEVLLPPDACADLVIELSSAMSGREAEDGGNVFSGANGGTRIGEQLTSLPFDLSSDPQQRGIECAEVLMTGGSSADVSIFDNGVELHPTQWIKAGTLDRLRYHRAGARRSGRNFAAPVDNLSLSLPGASASLDEMVARTKRGLLLTCLWYIREVDPSTLLLTGLTRDGVYLVEDGEIVGAVNNFRFNESPLDVLGRVVEAGVSERALSREWGEWMNRTAMPALRVADFNMSSVSQAS